MLFFTSSVACAEKYTAERLQQVQVRGSSSSCNLSSLACDRTEPGRTPKAQARNAFLQALCAIACAIAKLRWLLSVLYDVRSTGRHPGPLSVQTSAAELLLQILSLRNCPHRYRKFGSAPCARHSLAISVTLQPKGCRLADSSCMSSSGGRYAKLSLIAHRLCRWCLRALCKRKSVVNTLLRQDHCSSHSQSQYCAVEMKAEFCSQQLHSNPLLPCKLPLM